MYSDSSSAHGRPGSDFKSATFLCSTSAQIISIMRNSTPHAASISFSSNLPYNADSELIADHLLKSVPLRGRSSVSRFLACGYQVAALSRMPQMPLRQSAETQIDTPKTDQYSIRT